MKFRFIYCITAILLLTTPHLHAQTHKAKPQYTTVYLPDFFQYRPTKHSDTTFKYECYTRAHSQIDPDTLHDINSVDEIHYLKCYFQYPYKPNAVISPPYICPKEYIFAKTSDSTWYGKDMHTMIATGCVEHKKEIVRTDTVIIKDANTKTPKKVIHKYYRTIQVPASSVPAPVH